MAYSCGCVNPKWIVRNFNISVFVYISPFVNTCHRSFVRYNLDPFKQHSDKELWKALEKAHLREMVGVHLLQLWFENLPRCWKYLILTILAKISVLNCANIVGDPFWIFLSTTDVELNSAENNCWIACILGSNYIWLFASTSENSCWIACILASNYIWLFASAVLYSQPLLGARF